MAQTPEGKVKDSVKAALAAAGVFPFVDIVAGRVRPCDAVGFFYMPVAGRFSVLGVHDFVGCWAGRFFSIETKAPNESEDCTFHQERFHEAVTATGGFSFTGARDASVVARLRQLIEGVA